MRRLMILMVALPVLFVGRSTVLAQGTIRFHPPVTSGGGGVGTSEPADFSSPAGTLVVGGATGAVTFDADTSIIPLYSTGVSDPVTACTVGGMFHYRTDSALLKVCTAVTPTWTQIVTAANTSTSGFGFVVDEDTMISNSDTKVPTQQSVKAYVDANAGFDPSTTLDYYDDFCGGTTSGGLLGSMGWTGGVIASGTNSNNVTENATHPCLIRFLAHATNDNSGAYGHIGTSGGANALSLPWYTTDWSIEMVAIPGAVSATSIASSAIWFGLANTTADFNTATRAILIRRDTDMSDGTFFALVCNASGASGCASATTSTNIGVQASTITPTTGNGYRFRISRTGTGVGGTITYTFRVNDETAITICPNAGCTLNNSTAPTSGAMLVQWGWLTRVGTNPVNADFDYVKVRIPGLVRY